MYIHVAGRLCEQELAQVESHMSLVHGIVLQLTHLANRAEQIILIVDLKKIKVKTFSNKLINTAIKKVIALCTQYFPELLYKGFIVNAPMSFSQFWGTFESLIPPPTLAKFRVIGGATDPEISALVPKTVLPDTMGGSWNSATEFGDENEIMYGNEGDENEEIKGEKEVNAAKLFELKQVIMDSMPLFINILCRISAFRRTSAKSSSR